MRYMSDKEYKRRLHQIQKQNELKLKVQKLKDQRNKYKKKKITTSKLALWIMMAIMFEIVIFTQVIMWHFGDFSSLYVLIGIPAAMALPYFEYLSKAKVENTAGGITYDMAMREQDRLDSCETNDDLHIENISIDESGDNYPG